MTLSTCCKPVQLAALVYLGILVVLWSNDKFVFEFMSIANAKYNQRYYNSLLAPNDLQRSYHLDKEFFRPETKVKIILIWNVPFGETQAVGREENGCVRTYDRSAIDVADAVVFHFAELHDRPDTLPLDRRKPSQRWVWRCLESPWSTRHTFQKTLTPFNGIFNWTMTYRTDSDVYSSYERTLEKSEKTIQEMIAEKTAKNLAIWIVSNCNSEARNRFVEEMRKFIPIELMGKCHNKPVCQGDCQKRLINMHKFYLSFENSRCKDYITEKFWYNGLIAGAVPVVFGASRSDYEKVAPPHSFIHVNDFTDVRHLADYLLLLDKNDSLYGEYLRWRSIPDSEKGQGSGKIANRKRFEESGWAGLCEKLKKNSSRSKTNVVTNLDTWWYGEGYTANSKKFSICSADDGPSGRNLRPFVTFLYSIVVVLSCIITVKVIQRRGRGRARKASQRIL